MCDKLLWAVRNGDMDSLKAKKFDANCVVNGTPLLVSAADYGQAEVIKYLVENGADVNKASSHGITPLLAAIWEDHVKAVQMLLEKGANKNGKSPDGSSYVDAATSIEMKSLLEN